MVKKELKLAYGLAIALLVVGVICYTVPAKSPDQPLRMMFDSVAGRVLFNHQVHLSEDGYAVSCKDCHHHPEDAEGNTACGTCHSEPAEGEVAPASCLDCHDADELEGTETMKRSDAFHGQCINCHKDYESGPVECSGCHIQ